MEVLDFWRVERDRETGKSVLVGYMKDGSVKKIPLKIDTYTEDQKKD